MKYPTVHQRGAHEVVEVVDRAAFRTCRLHGYSSEHAKVILNNGEYFFLCELCFPKVKEPTNETRNWKELHQRSQQGRTQTA